MSEGPECQMKHKEVSLKPPKHNSAINFFNQDGEEVGVLDFNGPGMAFEGNAELSAIVFMDWVGKSFKARLDEEYARGLKDGKAFTKGEAKR